MSIKKVAVYGLGNMGYLVAERVAKQFETCVSDLDKTQTKRACEQLGAREITGEAELSDVEAVVLCLPNPGASRAVLKKIAPSLSDSTIVIETSTVNPDDMYESQKILSPYGLHIIDASILAGVSQMQAGTGTLLLGGDEEHIAVAQPVLDAISSKQIYIGRLGAGAASKVINNAVAHAVMVVVAEAGSLATATGVSSDKLLALLADPQMGLHRPLTHRYAERIVTGNYEGGMPLDAARKDSVLALELAQAVGVPMFAIQASHSVYEIAAAAGLGRKDYAAIAKLWEQWGKPTVGTTEATHSSHRNDPLR